MSEKFNPYSQWLGMSAETATPNHYELLGLPSGETDVKKIALAAEQAATKVRSFRPGNHAAQWASLIDEIQKAKLALLDPARREQYDQKLKVNGSREPKVAAGRPSSSAPAAKPASPTASDLFPPGFKPAAATRDEKEGREPSAVPQPTAPASAAPASAPQAPSPAAAPSAAYPAAGTSAPFPPSYGLPIAQPVGYPGMVPGAYAAPVSPAGIPTATSVAAMLPPGAAVAPQAYGAPQMYGAPLTAMPYAAPGPIDPMAPVAIPGVNVPQTAGVMPTAMTMGTAFPAYGMPGAVPMAAAAIPAMAMPVTAPSPTMPVETAPAGPQVRKASAAAVMLAARKGKQTRRAALLAGAVAGLVVVAGLVAYGVITGRLKWQTQESIADANPSDKIKEQDKKSSTTDEKTRKATSKQPVATDHPRIVPAPEVQPTPMPTPAPSPMPETKPEPKPQPMPAPTPTPGPAPAPETKPEPKPAPMPVVKPTRQQVAELETALKKARVALSEHTFNEAEAEIAKAEKLAMTPDHQTKVARLKLAVQDVKLFRQALSESAAQLEAAETIKVGSSTVVAIVETFPDKITVRVNGSNRTYSFADIPAGLATAIVDLKRQGGQPDSRVLKAMFVGTRKNADQEAIAQARGWLAEAAGGDSNAAELAKFFDDHYELVKEFDAAEKKAASDAKTADAAK